MSGVVWVLALAQNQTARQDIVKSLPLFREPRHRVSDTQRNQACDELPKVAT